MLTKIRWAFWLWWLGFGWKEAWKRASYRVRWLKVEKILDEWLRRDK